MKPAPMNFSAYAGCRYQYQYPETPERHDPLDFFIPSLGTTDLQTHPTPVSYTHLRAHRDS